MNRWLAVLTMVMAGLVSETAAAEITAEDADYHGPQWTLQVDPLTTALGFIHLQVERRFTSHFSVYAGPSLRLFSPPFGEDEDFYGIGVEVGMRVYFFGTAPKGWWGMVRGVAARLRSDVLDGETNGFGGYVSVLGGYTWIFGGWFVTSLGAGVQYLDYTLNGQGPSGVLPAAHTTIGVAF